MAWRLWGPAGEVMGGQQRLEGSEVRDWPKVKVTAGYLRREAFISTVALDRINTIRESV